jgi:uncharacterized protein YgbK (DUF1537 family)
MPFLGCIADDFTGATDLASALVSQGLRTIQTIGVPSEQTPIGDVDAVVVALKTRTAPVDEAIALSLAGVRSLQHNGCAQIYFKYCSTFDSTAGGNIGPVAEAIMKASNTSFTIACPAFPKNRRTIHQGYLFVDGVLLNESSMRHHPLTPMTDANLVRVLAAQTTRQVGHIDTAACGGEVGMVRARMEALDRDGYGFAVADATCDRDLDTLGEACLDMPVITGGSGLAAGLARALGRHLVAVDPSAAAALPAVARRRAVISGSCSQATNRQVAAMAARYPALGLDLDTIENPRLVEQAIHWASRQSSDQPLLIYSTADPAKVRAVQDRFGVESSSRLIEGALARIATDLVDRLGIRQLIVAGGETSGAVVEALGVRSLRIGGEIDPGVPWTVSDDRPERGPLALALKSGNFGSDDFFLKAWQSLV